MASLRGAPSSPARPVRSSWGTFIRKESVWFRAMATSQKVGRFSGLGFLFNMEIRTATILARVGIVFMTTTTKQQQLTVLLLVFYISSCTNKYKREIYF